MASGITNLMREIKHYSRIIGPHDEMIHRDRSLRGKARIKARKAHQRKAAAAIRQ